MTMQKPRFVNLKRPDANWSNEELKAWIGLAEANPSKVPWRLEWLDAAKDVLSARLQAGLE